MQEGVIEVETIEEEVLVDNSIEEYMNDGGITIIEWADMINDRLPEERLEIKFKIIDENTRVLRLIPYGRKYEEICEVIA